MGLKREETIHSEPFLKTPQALRESGTENPPHPRLPSDCESHQAPRRSVTETFPTAKVREVRENSQEGELPERGDLEVQFWFQPRVSSQIV